MKDWSAHDLLSEVDRSDRLRFRIAEILPFAEILPIAEILPFSESHSEASEQEAELVKSPAANEVYRFKLDV